MKHASLTRRIRNLFCKSEKLVTTCSLRLGFDLLREKNCIELRPILSDCRVRDRENLAGSAPRYPLFANHLIQKKESISRLLGICDSGGIRTHDPQLRRLLLYPTELRNQSYFRCRSVVKMDCSPLKLRKSNTKFPICKISRCRIVKYQLFSPTLYLNQYFTTASQISRHTPTSPDIA